MKWQPQIKMFSSSIVLTILGLFAGFTVNISNGLELRHKRSMLYHGPLAPINQDGTVAFTSEVQQAKFTHQAAFAAELQRLMQAERLAAAHPDLTSPKHGYNSNIGQYHRKYNQPTTQQYYPVSHLQAPLNHDGTVANTAEVRNAAAAQKAAFAAEHKRLQEAERLAAAHPDFTSPSHGYDSYSKGNQNQQNAFQYSQEKSYNYRPQVYVPAPLNQDGTVAFTPEVQQARAAHQAAIAAEFQRFNEAARLAAAYPDYTTPQKGYFSYNKGLYNQNNAVQYNQQPQKSAPLNQYGSVANTVEAQNAAAAQAAFASEFKRIQYVANLAAAHPDLASRQGSYSSGKSRANQGSHYAYNPLARIPAPLNQDGTVAHTPEYRAIAAAHQAEYAKALQRNKQHGYFSGSQHTQPNNYYGHY